MSARSGHRGGGLGTFEVATPFERLAPFFVLLFPIPPVESFAPPLPNSDRSSVPPARPPLHHPRHVCVSTSSVMCTGSRPNSSIDMPCTHGVYADQHLQLCAIGQALEWQIWLVPDVVCVDREHRDHPEAGASYRPAPAWGCSCQQAVAYRGSRHCECHDSGTANGSNRI